MKKNIELTSIITDNCKILMTVTGMTVKTNLLTRPELKNMEHSVDDYIILTAQFAVDEIEDTYEILKTHPPEHVADVKDIESLSGSDDLKRIVRQIEDICGDTAVNFLSSAFLS